MTIELAKFPPLMLDWMGPDYLTKEKFTLRGTMYHVIPVPTESALVF
jgi:hypothetical protein